ncbi:MAG: hypothetical protein VX733_15580 [Candidatus Latescibacterota bacterium]|nr:hypothetical protein [Candidatus Latescibacterota bacterium]
MHRHTWTFGLAHEEHLLDQYNLIAMADYSPGAAVSAASVSKLG